MKNYKVLFASQENGFEPVVKEMNSLNDAMNEFEMLRIANGIRNSYDGTNTKTFEDINDNGDTVFCILCRGNCTEGEEHVDALKKLFS